MKTLLALCSLTLLLFSCKEKSKEYSSIEEVLQDLAPGPQVFYINPMRDTVVQGANGVRFFFPANTFQKQNGTFPHGNIAIHLKECNTFSEMLAENLRTYAQPEMIFETGGMVNVSVIYGKKNLVVANQKAYAIYLPSEKKRKPYFSFSPIKLENRRIVWLPENEMASDKEFDSFILEPSQKQPTLEGFTDCISWPANHTERADSIVSWKLANGNDIFSFADAYFDRASLPSVTYPDCPLMKVDFGIDKQGAIYNIQFDASSSKDCQSIILNFLNALPLFDMRSMPHREHGYSLTFGFNALKERRKFNTAFYERNYSLTDLPQTKYFVSHTNQLGWVNLGARWSGGCKGTVNYYVESPNLKKGIVVLLFQEGMAMSWEPVKNGEAFFHKIPKGRRVKVLYLDVNNGEILCSTGNTITSGTPYKLTEPKEISLEQLKYELDGFEIAGDMSAVSTIAITPPSPN
jgi:hypothetical protein